MNAPYGTGSEKTSNEVSEVTEQCVSDTSPGEQRESQEKVLKKLDWYIIPVCMLLYFCAFLDRGNYSNILVTSFPSDIGLKGTQENVAASIFYVTYVVIETPASVLAKRLRPDYVIAFIAFAWSMTTTLSGLMQNYAGLLATRLILGACEGGLFPAVNVYLSGIYRRDEQAKRVAFFLSSAPLSGAFGGLLAYVILKMDGVSGLQGWRWLYIIEGLFSLVVAILSFVALPHNPRQAFFLNARERDIMEMRYQETLAYNRDEQFEWTEVGRAFSDPKVYLSAFTQICEDITLYGYSTFLPTIIKGIGYTSVQAQYLSIPVYVYGALVYLLSAWLADRTMKRSPFILIGNGFGIAGYAILLAVAKPGVQLFATFLIAMSIYTAVGLNLTWLLGNLAGPYKRATGFGMQQTFGNCGGIIAGQLYTTSTAPRYITGHAVSLGAIVLAVVCTVVQAMYLKMGNQRKALAVREGKDDTGKGDESISFMFTY